MTGLIASSIMFNISFNLLSEPSMKKITEALALVLSIG